MATENEASVQVMFNGPYFNLKWLLSKTEKEFEITFSRGNSLDPWSNVANLSTTLAHMADWALAFKPSLFSNCEKISDVRKLIKEHCYKATLFFDIANEYKHANRREQTKSEITSQVLFRLRVFPKREFPIELDDKRRLVNYNTGRNGDSVTVLTLTIKDFSGNEFLLYDCAESAIDWWRKIVYGDCKINKNKPPLK